MKNILSIILIVIVISMFVNKEIIVIINFIIFMISSIVYFGKFFIVNVVKICNIVEVSI